MKDIRNGRRRSTATWSLQHSFEFDLELPRPAQPGGEIYPAFNDFLINCISAVAVNFGLCVLKLLGNDSSPLRHYNSQEMWCGAQTFWDDHIPGCPLTSCYRLTCGTVMMGCLLHEHPCDLSGGVTGNHIRAFPKKTIPDLWFDLWGRSIAGSSHPEFTFVPKQISFLRFYDMVEIHKVMQRFLVKDRFK